MTSRMPGDRAWRPLSSILTLTTLLACASTGNGTGSRETHGPIEGTYEFFASIPGQHLRGKLRVVADTILFDTRNDCGSIALPTGRMFINGRDATDIPYGCKGALLTFNRRNPTQGSKWLASVSVQKRRETCSQFVMRNGREVCSRTRIETYESTESRSGILQVRRSQ